MADRRSGHVALIGEPNAGKSTLMNRIVGSKVSIVTHKAQTTRSRVRGIAVRNQSQIVFVDTPGLFAPRRKLDRAMVSAAWKSLAGADIVLLTAQAHRGLNAAAAAILDRLDREPPPEAKIALVINKIDLVRRESLLALAAEFAARREFESVFMISAARGDGVSDLADWLAENLPPGGWMYPSDQIADASLQSMAAEITREKLLLRMHQEIPYRISVETDRWHTERDGSVRVDQTVFVASKSHKRMVIGPGGTVIRQIGTEARRGIQDLAGCRVHLFLQVKLRPKWEEDASRYESMGLSYSDTMRGSRS